jgi:hypothetical protein
LKIIKKLISELKKITHKNIGQLQKIFILSTINFGNQIMALNNLIYLCIIKYLVKYNKEIIGI